MDRALKERGTERQFSDPESGYAALRPSGLLFGGAVETHARSLQLTSWVCAALLSFPKSLFKNSGQSNGCRKRLVCVCVFLFAACFPVIARIVTRLTRFNASQW